MSQNNLVRCYKGIQRIYRNAIVRFIRSKLSKAFPDTYLEKVRAPFQKEWKTIKQNALAARDSGELDSALVDEIDLLGVNHFFNLFDAYFEILCSDKISAGKNEVKKQKITVLGWLRSIKNLRDPLSHPSEEDFSREDSFFLLDTARRVLQYINLSDPAAEIKDLMDEVVGKPLGATREPLERQLPPRESIVIGFVGRREEMNDLWKWFSDPVSRKWALAGEGGKGKSALAYNFALAVAMEAPQPFQTVFWLSAKRKRFLEGATIEAEPDFNDLDSVLSRILGYYGWTDEVEYPTESKKERALELLDQFPALVVVDDVDSLESENEDVITLFSDDLPRSKSKVLFTSRRTIFGMGGATTHVIGFSEPETEEFILSRCPLMELDASGFNKRIILRILKVTEGSPLYIEDLMRFSAAVSSVEKAIALWEERGGNEARRYALGRECELLGLDARRVLITATICPHAISFTEIESISGLSADAVTAALKELQKLFLVPKPKLIQGEQRFEINVNTRSLIRDSYGSDDLYKRYEAACRTISEGVPSAGKGAIGAIIRQAVFLERGHQFPEAEQLLLNALEKYASNPDLTGVLGKLYKSWNRITDARERFKRAWQLKCSKQEMYEHWCNMEIREREWTKAATAAEKGLKLLGESKRLLYLAGYARSRLARELMERLQRGKADKELELAKEYLRRGLDAPSQSESDDKEVDSDIYRAMVIACELSANERELRSYIKLWRDKYPDDPDLASETKRISGKMGIHGL